MPSWRVVLADLIVVYAAAFMFWLAVDAWRDADVFWSAVAATSGALLLLRAGTQGWD